MHHNMTARDLSTVSSIISLTAPSEHDRSILLAARASDSLCLRARADHPPETRQTEQTRQVVRNKTAR